MTATTTRKVTIDLPENLVARLNNVAEYRQQPFDMIVSNILESSLDSITGRDAA